MSEQKKFQGTSKGYVIKRNKMVKNIHEGVDHLHKIIGELNYSEDIFIEILRRENLIEKYFDEDGGLLPGILDWTDQ